MIRVTLLERGQVRTLELEAEALESFKEGLASRGASILETEVLGRSLWERLNTRVPSPEQWAPWFSALSRTLKGGVPLDKSLDLLADAAPMPASVRDLHRAVVGGSRFSEAATKLPGLPTLIPALLRAGEAAGDLARGAALAHQSLLDLVAFRRELRARLSYPLVVVSAAALALTVLMLKVFPAMAGMWANMGKPLPPRLEVIRIVGWVAVLVLALLGSGIAWLTGGGEGAQRLPGFRSLGRHRARCEAWSALAMALGGGVTLPEALALLGPRWGAPAALEAIRTGIRPEVALAAWVDDAAGLRAVLLASLRIGDLPSGAAQVADGYRELLASDLQKLQRWLEPAILILLGGILMSLAWSLFSIMGEMEHGLVK